MENYTAKDILKEIKNIFPKYKTRKRSYVDKRNYLICILYYRFNYSEEMIADIFSLTKFAIDRSTVNYAKKQPTVLINLNDQTFIQNVAEVYEKFPFRIPKTKPIRFKDKTVTMTFTNKELCRIIDYADNNEITKGEAVKKLMEIGLNISGTNLTEMLLWEE